jgi:hypothetical protein
VDLNDRLPPLAVKDLLLGRYSILKVSQSHNINFEL